MISAGQNTAFSRNKTLNLGGRIVSLDKPVVMGILNITPDSFFSGSRAMDESSILKQAERMLTEGALILDVGGYSSRPEASDIPVEEELKRVTLAIRVIKQAFPDAILSIDTYRASVASAAVRAGASMINDISGGELDDAMLRTVAELNVPYICMHMMGTPQTMSQLTDYENVVFDIVTYFHKKMNILQAMGIKDIIIDPGFGFAKTAEQNFQLLHHLDHFKVLTKPVLVGLSRKSMIWRTLNIIPDEALNGTTALNMVALIKGASILRVHDVKEAVECIQLYTKFSQSPIHSAS